MTFSITRGPAGSTIASRGTAAATVRLRLRPCIRMLIIVTAFAVAFDVPWLRQISALAMLLLVPGTLTILALGLRCESKWSYLPLAVGLSISLLMLVGLLANEAYRALGSGGALTATNVCVFVLLGSFIASELLLRSRDHLWVLEVTRHPISRNVRALAIPLLFPPMAVGGAIMLNQPGSSILAIATVVAVAAYTAVVVFRHEQMAGAVLPFSILMIALAMLLSWTFRSWRLSGWDIHQEYYVYRLTEESATWSMAAFRDPYNACLSINIFPVIVNRLANMNDELLFKVLYTAIFSLVPLVVYLTARRFLGESISYLGALFFIFQAWYVQPMPALARQQVALLFFALLVWALGTERWSKHQRVEVALLMGGSLILSHYSTSYIALGLLAVVALFSLAFGRIAAMHRLLRIPSGLMAGVTAALIALAVLWGAVFTDTSGNILYVGRVTLLNMRDAFSADLRSEDVLLALGLGDRTVSEDDVKEYVRTQTELHVGEPGLYPAASYAGYEPRPVTSRAHAGILPDGGAATALNRALGLLKQLTKVMLVVGGGVLAWRLLRALRADSCPPGRPEHPQDEAMRWNTWTLPACPLEYALMAVLSLAVLVAFMVAPVLSRHYNLYRVYMQTLVVSAVCMPLGASALLALVRRAQVRERIVGVLLITFYLASYGVTAYITGGDARMTLSGFGEDYDKFYTHEHEVRAAEWLHARRGADTPVYADELSALRLISYGQGLLDVNTAILPSTITRDAYVFLRYANVHEGLTEAVHQGKQISYNYPLDFLHDNKNLVYDNGGSRIFR